MKKYLVSGCVFVLMVQLLSPLSVLATDQQSLVEDAPRSLDGESEPVEAVDVTPEPELLIAAPPVEPQERAAFQADALVVASVPITEPQPQPSNTGNILISKVQIGDAASTKNEYVELYNNSNYTVSLAGWKLEFLTEKHNSIDPPTRVLKSFTTQIIEPHSYYVISYQGYLAPPTSDAVFDVNVSSGSLPLNGAVRLRDSMLNTTDMVGWGSSANYETTASTANPIGSIDRCITVDGGMIDTNDNRSDMQVYVYTDGPQLRASTACISQVVVEEPPVNMCEGILLSEIHANTSDSQYIELFNSSGDEVDLSGCGLQTNRSATARFTFTNLTLPANMFTVVYIKDTTLTLTKTTTGSVYLLSSDDRHEIDMQTYSGLPVDMSWARIGEQWQRTYDVTPNAANQLRHYLPCEQGYERNEQTGRCNKTAELSSAIDCGEGKYRSDDTGRCRQIPAASVLAACKLGQYRSEETNRCRNLVTAAALTPCKEDQYRSEETNRCRNLASAANQLVPCKEGQERSLETNRCRNVAKAVPSAAFAVKPVGDSAKVFVGWWALGGVTLAALLYAGWEWRYEVRQWIRRIPPFSIRRK